MATIIALFARLGVPQRLQRLLAWILAGIVAALVLGVMLTLRDCSAARTANTQTKLATGQAGAAIASGTDAVGTVGNRQAADLAGDKTTEETKDAIDKATDAGGVTDAGRSGLCRLAGYRGKPECLRKPHP